ncbi:hypothetical protein DL240_18170 [Lujinxingia litoralis]|uniref:Tc1-like transposase DDE domain-containing protein n=1 Tax=Lujinxingia litoralis TaxID=2211119 RepID=A0A328C702_9DELT|nr:hypothetical protein DL240_18170 [Lujinxingia litoralis]
MNAAGVASQTTFNNALIGLCFIEWLEHSLCPTLKPVHVVVMDNLKVHNVVGVNEAIEPMLLYLPPYS